MTTTSIKHSSIGSIQGSTAKDGVTQFLGLKYATLADRFAPAVLKEYGSEQSLNATTLGPQALSISPGPGAEFGLIQHALEYDETAFTQSDTDCLTLNVTVPRDASSNLPVFTFIHGGGFMVGSSAYPQYDMARLVQLSVESGRPCIAVTLNYRLGAPGFLTSSAMRAAGYESNNGLRDQRVALQWIHEHISGFGGDPENITLAGESAGGISVCAHLFSKQPLFKRMISMSGTMLLMPPMTLDQVEENYNVALKALGLTSTTAIEHLLKVNDKELVGRFAKSGIPLTLVDDKEIFPTTFNFKSIANGQTPIPGKDWCQSAMVGDCQFDGSINALRLMHKKKSIASVFCSSMSKSLAPHSGLADKLLKMYDMKSDLEDDDALFRILQFSNDIDFYIPARVLAGSLSSSMKTFQYRFNEPNPWDGPLKGHAAHVLDVAFLFQNFNDFLDERQKGVAVQFAKDVLAFVSGEEPWTAGADVAKVLDPHEGMTVVDDVPERTGRRTAMLQLGEEVGFDVINDAFNVFMRGPLAV